jgi:eukaryotic-like serine/threonine-protein kinase
MSQATRVVELDARPSDAIPGAPSDHQLSDFVGTSYRRIRRIGSGGMADVYEVEHVRLGSRFAAKILRPGRAGWENAVRRFLREARLLARLKSDHLVRVVDVSSDEHDPPFYVMELLDGQDVRGLLQSGAEISVSRALKLTTDACVGLSVAHVSGLVHRDLKPENLFIVHRDSGEEVCKLLDFGVSKGAAAASTEAGGLIGTVAYMAPEQVESASTVTARADVYSVGAILYELLTGRPPHAADTVERLLFKILSGPIAPIGALRPGVPAEIEQIVERALSRDPAKRHANAQELAEALQRAAASAALSVTLGGELSVRPSGEAKRRRLLRSAVGVALLGGGVLAAAWLSQPAAPESFALDGDPGAALVARASDARPAPPATSSPETPAKADIAPSADAFPPASASSVLTTGSSSGGPKRVPLAKRAIENAPPSSSSPSAVASAHTAVPKIQFELQNPYAH